MEHIGYNIDQLQNFFMKTLTAAPAFGLQQHGHRVLPGCRRDGPPGRLEKLNHNIIHRIFKQLLILFRVRCHPSRMTVDGNGQTFKGAWFPAGKIMLPLRLRLLLANTPGNQVAEEFGAQLRETPLRDQ
ncbi:hypothetical protein D3C75_1088400 [compost metagenome]